MNFAKTSVFTLCFAPLALHAADDFTMSAQVLAAARAGNARQVQILVNSGANVNFVDATGLSLVCTALMNNDMTAVQILQSYGADSSTCDTQIKTYKAKNTPQQTGGFFSGLSTTQGMVLTGAVAAAAIGGVVLLTDVFDHDNDNNTTGGSSGGGSSGGGSSTTSGTAWSAGALPYGPSMVNAAQESANYANNLAYYAPSDEESILYQNFYLMNHNPNLNYNYLLLMRGYSPLARGYLGQRTLRNPTSHAPLALRDSNGDWLYSYGAWSVQGGRPVNVALVTANGINAAADTSLENKFLVWAGVNTDGTPSPASAETIYSKYYNNLLTPDGANEPEIEEDTSFDLSGSGTAIHNTAASDSDNMLAKIVGGNDAGYANADFFGFMPNGQMTIYRTGGGAGATDYKNYSAILDAAVRKLDLANGRSKVSVIANLDVIEPLHETEAKTINDLLSVAATDYKTTFAEFVGAAYGTNDINDLPADKATSFFNNLGSLYTPLTVFSTGASKTDSTYSGAYKLATFENAAPLVYANSNHLFMSVVAVGSLTPNGTIAANTAGNQNQYELSKWQDTASGNYYKSRVCGIAGAGSANIDPWCFAAVGLTDEMATAAAAGAAGVLMSAFDYMTPQEIFTLLALTADGPLMARTTAGASLTSTELLSYLQGQYDMPNEYQFRIDNGEDYMDVFKEVYGYGVINLERATTPGTNLFFYDGTKIISTSGNAYWRAAANTGLRTSSALNIGRVAVDTAAYDVLESVDGSMSLPRIWKNSFTLGDDGRHALYMGDVLGDLKTRAADDDTVQFGDFAFSLTRSPRAYNDAFGGLDNMRLSYTNANWNLAVDYQHYLTNGESRFYGMSNPVLNLASNAISGGANYRAGKWSFGGRAFSGVITDEGLLQTDPTILSEYEPMRLGLMSGAAAELGWRDANFGLMTSFGAVCENNTVLGAYATGLMGIDATDTNYVDIDAFWRPTDSVRLRARATFARSDVDMRYGTQMALSPLASNAFALGADIANWSFGASMPLAVTNGAAHMAYADYEIITDENGHYDLAIRDMGTQRIDMAAHSREVRLNAIYRHRFGEFTDGALGFIYRIHPNHTSEFGNESVFMMKLTHALGI
ncbi:MAG: hypothetical protein J5611_02770 [Alphaproteobacteria bacterium]|nr:hypothetical protein [Alphaproteobacteria bacterium]